LTGTTWLLVGATAILWGIIPIIDKLALNHSTVSPWLGIGLRAGAVTFLAWPFLLWGTPGIAGLRAISWQAAGLFIASGIISLLLAQYCYYALLQQAGVARIFPFLFSAAPMVTLLCGVLVLGESLTLKQFLGALLVIGGGLLLL
jgi:transporter family protein